MIRKDMTMAVNDPDVIKECIRVEARSGSTRILVYEVFWKGPYEHVVHWTEVQSLSVQAGSGEVETAVQRLLENPRFFGLCVACSQRRPTGWMHNEEICRSCSWPVLGVVY